MKAVARQRLAGGQGELDLGVDHDAATAGGSGPLQIASSRMAPLWEALCSAYDQLGFDIATGSDEVFRQLVLARIIEPTSKFDSLRVLGEVGIETVSYATVKRRLQRYAPSSSWRSTLPNGTTAKRSKSHEPGLHQTQGESLPRFWGTCRPPTSTAYCKSRASYSS